MITGPHGERCDEVVCHQKIEFSGPHTSTVYLLNPQRRQVKRIKVDGCAITKGKRCDWMARTEGNSAEEIFIELKGVGRIQRAAHQLEATIKLLSNDIKKLKKRCLVVCTSMSLLSTAAQQYKERFKREYNARLMIVRNCTEISLNG
jgi:hypothetical protein